MKLNKSLQPNSYHIFILVCSFLLSASSLSSQSWLQDGQTWTYYVFGGWDPDSSYGIFDLTVTGDTIVEDIECKVLTLNYPTPSLSIAYADQDAIYAYISYKHRFLKIYDFSMEVGGTLELLYNKKYRVDSIGTMEVSGQDLRFQYVSFFGDQWEHGPYLVLEGLGFIGKVNENAALPCSYFFINDIPCNSALDEKDFYFQCYNNSDFIYDPEGLCVETATDELTEQTFKIYPNPTADFFIIESPAEVNAELATLYDVLGRTIYRTKIIGSRVNVAHLQPQTYFLKITDQNGLEYFSKIVVNR